MAEPGGASQTPSPPTPPPGAAAAPEPHGDGTSTTTPNPAATRAFEAFLMQQQRQQRDGETVQDARNTPARARLARHAGDTRQQRAESQLATASPAPGPGSTSVSAAAFLASVAASPQQPQEMAAEGPAGVATPRLGGSSNVGAAAFLASVGAVASPQQPQEASTRQHVEAQVATPAPPTPRVGGGGRQVSPAAFLASLGGTPQQPHDDASAQERAESQVAVASTPAQPRFGGARHGGMSAAFLGAATGATASPQRPQETSSASPLLTRARSVSGSRSGLAAPPVTAAPPPAPPAAAAGGGAPHSRPDDSQTLPRPNRYRDAAWQGYYEDGGGHQVPILLHTSRSKTMQASGIASLRGLAWDGQAHLCTVNGDCCMRPPFKWTLELEDAHTGRILKLGGALNVKQRCVAGECVQQRQRATPWSTQPMGKFLLRSVGDVPTASCLPSSAQIQALGWSSSWFDYHMMTCEELAPLLRHHGLQGAAAAMAGLAQPLTTVAALIQVTPWRLEKEFGVPQSEVQGLMRVLSWLVMINETLRTEAAHGQYQHQHQSRELDAAAPRYFSPMSDRLFMQICGFHDLLMMPADQLVACLNDTDSSVGLTPRRWTPRAPSLMQSIERLEAFAEGRRPQGLSTTGRDLFLMAPPVLGEVGIAEAVVELFDFFLEYVEFLEGRENQLQKVQAGDFCGIVTLNSVSSVHSILRARPELATIDAYQLAPSEEMRLLIHAYLAENPGLLAAQPAPMYQYDPRPPSDAPPLAGPPLVGLPQTILVPNAAATINGPAAYRALDDDAPGCGQGWVAFFIWLCVAGLHVVTPILVTIPPVMLAAGGLDAHQVAFFSIWPLGLGVLCVYGVLVFGSVLQSARPTMALALKPWFWAQLIVFLCLVALAAWNLNAWPGARAYVTVNHWVTIARTIVSCGLCQRILVAYAREGHVPGMAPPAWARGKPHRVLACFTLVGGLAATLLAAIEAGYPFPARRLWPLWLLDAGLVFVFGWASRHWDSWAAGAGDGGSDHGDSDADGPSLAPTTGCRGPPSLPEAPEPRAEHEPGLAVAAVAAQTPKSETDPLLPRSS